MIHVDDRERVENTVKKTLIEGGDGDFDIEFRTINFHERSKWLKAKGRAYFNADGLSIRFIGTLLDITVQKLIDEATRELLKKKDEFVSIASHELKTPITSLKAALQMIERMAMQKEEIRPVLSFVQKGIKQVDKLIELVKDLLDVTKIQAGKLDLRKTRFLLSELISECCEELQADSATHQLLIEGDTEVYIHADKNRIEQVLINLLSNAIKYSPGTEKVVIRVSDSEAGTKIEVIDFGIGIPKSKQQFLFDRFYRVDDVSQRYAGLGLGLYISSEIVRRHHGYINIESEEGKGSNFWFIIPH